MNNLQTILGAGGAFGIALAKALKKHTNNIRLVSRNPKKVNESDRLFPADLLKYDALRNAIKDSEVVYVCVGFEYSTNSWEAKWPKLMKHLTKACTEENCKLVFFDNMYMYDADYLDGMTEETPINPRSNKGKVRAEVAQILLDAVNNGNFKGLIARSADYYGSDIHFTSMLTENVFKPFSKGKKAYWLQSIDYKHSFTYIPDAAKATALLGNTEEAYNQVWHLPTASNPLTGKEWIESIAKEMGVKPKYQVLPNFMLSILGVFIPIMREIKEMTYQYNRDYVFNSDKFNKKFDFKPTPYIEGIREIIRRDYK